MIRELKENLQRSINHMKEYYYRGYRKETFQVGNMVYLKLQPHSQQTISQKTLYKLGCRYYGPFRVSGRLGEVAYKLDLPSDAQIHPVVHVSQAPNETRNFNDQQVAGGESSRERNHLA